MVKIIPEAFLDKITLSKLKKIDFWDWTDRVGQTAMGRGQSDRVRQSNPKIQFTTMYPMKLKDLLGITSKG